MAPDFEKMSRKDWDTWWNAQHPPKQLSTVSATPVIVPVSKPGPERTIVRHLISVVAEKGDKLKSIADYAGITVSELAKLNRIRNPKTYKVKAGEEFIVPDPDARD